MGTSKSFGSSRQSHLARLSGPIIALAMILSIVLMPAQVATAAASLSVTPLTWNVIGLDSNNVNVGPNQFPVGARVCNTGDTAAANVTASFVWDSLNPYIILRPGTSNTLSVLSLPPTTGNCTDFYFEVEVTRTSAAYDTTRNYHIAVTADGVVPVSTPTPRQLYVERLISQSRNSVNDVQLNSVSIPAGGTMSLMVGNTYDIKLVGSTATNGYEQIESFLTLQNTIFRINSVATTYSANAGTDSAALTKPYANGCNWENNPSSLNYRSCLATGKYGGDITVTYNVTVIAGAGTAQSLNSLIYDFSGSSYHYNADYGVSARFAKIVNAGISKAFSPKTINPFGVSTLTFTINNPGAAALTGVNFVDNLPAGTPSGQMSISSPTVSYSGCGPAPLPTLLTVGAISLSFTDIEVASLGTCTITVNVTASIDATYNNTSGNLFINGTTDTGSFATDTLVVSSKPAAPPSCASPATMATWSLENYTASTSTNNGPFLAFSRASDVSTATGTYGAAAGSLSGIANTTTYPTNWDAPSLTDNSGNSWGIRGGWLNPLPTDPATATTPYFQFQVDASNYGGIGIAANYNLQGNWSNSGNWYVLYSADGVNWSSQANGVWNKSNAWQVNGVAATTTATGNAAAYFRVYAAGAQYGGNPSETNGTMYLDSIRITGCPRPVLPTLAKAFSPTPIPQGDVSTLTFSLANPNATALTGVGFSDTLPTGLLIASPDGLTTSCTLPGTLTGGTTTAMAGTRTISLSGATLSANANCTISVNVLGSVAGQYTNVSGSITSAETGSNTTSTGFGTSSLTVIAPPVIAKSFATSPILTGNTTELTFSIYNPNTVVQLTGVNFTDDLADGLVVADPNGLIGSCGGGIITAGANSSQVKLANATLTAGQTCTFSVNVKGNTPGLKANSVTVSSTNGGAGNTSTANVLVKDPAPAIKLLKQVGPTNAGPWTSFLNVSAGAEVYYRFIVENMGDVELTSVIVTDPTLMGTGASPAGCTWPNPLPVASPTQDPTATCVRGPITAASGAHPNTASASGTYTPPVGQPVNVTSSSSATYYTSQQLALDFGDLPDTGGATGTGDYQTELATGPRHLMTGNLYLGACVDSETDGQQTTGAVGDNGNTGTTTIGTCNPSLGDEDGITRNMSERWTLGTTVHLSVTFVGSGELACWIDWTGNGSLGDNANKFSNVGPVSTSPKVVDVPIPNDGSYALGRALYVRCRLFPTGGAPGGTLTQDDYTGYAPGGEVEDYYWEFNNANAVTLRDLQATTMSTGVRLMELLRGWLQR